jgi:glycosyltransferase involved in cell wall biosynthesis
MEERACVTHMREKRILMMVYSVYPSDPRVRREAESLEEAGYYVDVLCLRPSGEARKIVLGNVTAYRIMLEDFKRESLGRYFFFTSIFLLRCFILALKWSLTRHYDLVQVHNMPDHLVFAALPLKLKRVKVLLDLHDLTPELFLTKWNHGSKRSLRHIVTPIIQILEKMSCGFSDHLLTTSDGFKDRLVSRGIPEGKIDIIHNSANEKIFDRTLCNNNEVIQNEGPKLIYHGTVAFRFGLHIVIMAMPHLVKHFPEVSFNIYGGYEPAYRKYLEDLVIELGLEEHVKLGGYLTWEQVAQVICQADIGIVPYIEDEFMNLALSTKGFEYVVMRLPVVASRLDSIKRIFSEEAVAYFSSEDSVGLADRVASIMNGGVDIRESMTSKAFDEYKNIRWSSVSKRYQEIVHKLAE